MLAIAALAVGSGSFALAHTHDDVHEARIVEIDHDERQITVMYDDQSTSTYTLAKDAEIYSWDGARERPHSFAAFAVGQDVELEFDEKNGEVRRLGSQDSG